MEVLDLGKSSGWRWSSAFVAENLHALIIQRAWTVLITCSEVRRCAVFPY